MILGFGIQTEMGWIHGSGLILPISFGPIQFKVQKKNVRSAFCLVTGQEINARD